MRVPISLLAGLSVALCAGGCARLRSHQGYVVDAELMNSVQPGVDNRDSVLKVLGEPSFRAGFGGGDWYYLSRNSRNYAFTKPHPTDQLTVQISFDAAGNVTAVRRSGADQIAAVSPDHHVTPTLGRKRGFLQDLFGNIGTVGAAGAGGDNGDNTGGGGRTRP